MVRTGLVFSALLLGAIAAAPSCTAVLDVPQVTVAHATCEDGKCVCEEHYAHCVSSSPDLCETHLLTASKHCGACGHDCLGGACKGGACQPVVIDRVEGARGLVAFGGEVYLGVCRDIAPDAGPDILSFLKLDFEGGAPVEAIRAPRCGELPLLAGSTLYWSGTRELGQGAISSIAMPPASVTPTVTTVVDGTIAVGMAVTAKNLYWRELKFEEPATWTDTGLWTTPLQGGTPELIIAESTSVAASGDAVFWSSPEGAAAGRGLFMRAEGSTMNVLLSGLPAINMAADAGHVYTWVKEGTSEFPQGIYAIPVPIPDPASPPKPKLLVPEVKSMGSIFTDGKTLTWIENVASEIRSVELKPGAVPRVLVKNVGFGGVARLAADEKAVYFIGDSVVGRVAR